MSNNEFLEFPEVIENMKTLKILHLHGNQLTNLPESIRNFRELKYLYIGLNQLTTLPQWINSLVGLKELNLSFNRTLTTLPTEILQLPSSCKVDLTACGLSTNILGNLREAMSALNYNGPIIHFSILDCVELNREKSLDELLQDLSIITGKTLALPHIFSSSEEEIILKIWLGRLCEIADNKAGGGKKKAITNNIQNYLKQANDNLDFKEIFYAIIHGATETCGDRVALSLLHIGLKFDLNQLGLIDTKRLANFLIRGVFVIGLLEDVARAKVDSLRFVDEIEVYLGYPIMLKGRLELPINIEEMLYARCSHITSADLDVAEAFINEQLANEEVIFNFLIKQDKWIAALDEHYPNEMREFKSQREKLIAEAVTSEAIIEIEREYHAALVKLTKEELTPKS